MIIDKLSNITFTQEQLTKRAQSEIANKWSQAKEDNIKRKLQGVALGLYVLDASEQLEVDQYKLDLEAVQIESAQAVVDNQLLMGTIEYENALARLAQYQLSVGKPVQEVFETQIDPLTGDPLQVLIRTIPAIDPLPATITVPDYDPVTGDYIADVTLPNPEIVADDADRAVAQLIVNGASTQSVALASSRIA